jgi:hypothetical protein
MSTSENSASTSLGESGLHRSLALDAVDKVRRYSNPEDEQKRM